ncbi:MAG: PhoH family protein [Clostridiales bacterium]|nr:PhoH family protein [Clostridiales bacterium]
MKKNYIIDTNVMIHDPNFIYKFEDNNVIIPLICIEELDKLKNAKGITGYHAREALRVINRFRTDKNLDIGVPLPEGGLLRIEMNHMDFKEMPDALDHTKNDNKILAIVLNLEKIYERKNQKTILISKDLAMSIKADSLGLEVQDYQNDKVDINKLYEGFQEISLATETINQIYSGGLPVVNLPEGIVRYENHFLHIKNIDDESHQTLAKISNGKVVPLEFLRKVTYGLKPLNREQKFGIELLLDESIPMVTITGGAGSGKTIMATAAALELYFEGKYNKIVFVRPVVPAGEDIGFLPGTEEEKLRPWMGPLYDSVETLLYLKSKYAKGMEQTAEKFIGQLKESGALEVKTFNYMRGRTLERAIVIVDEAQQITPHLAKLMLTRAGKNSKFIFLGDPTDNQIDSVLVDSKSNGLVYLVDKLKEYDITGHITLKHVERSVLAMLAEANL